MAVHLNQPAEHLPRVLQWIALVSVDKDFFVSNLKLSFSQTTPLSSKSLLVKVFQ